MYFSMTLHDSRIMEICSMETDPLAKSMLMEDALVLYTVHSTSMLLLLPQMLLDFSIHFAFFSGLQYFTYFFIHHLASMGIVMKMLIA